MLFLHIDMAQVVQILFRVRQQLTYSAWVLMYGDARSQGISTHDIYYLKPN